MISQNNQSALLKEYIKTLFASKPVFPGILPRKWGKDFSDDELYQVYTALKAVLKQADPYSRESLIREFEGFDYTPQQLNWYLRRFWREIVKLIIETSTPNIAAKG
ncbi:hypothetical protein GO730_36525 [Spirosoma sp. HMF3257]|uniref:Uncharacterized protein n=1 Tax=Spirosoma telluris TaxID=2183553 RepID=A0A327NSH4_9BACT|nr:hypothetical protein [Spirosoma telluris]RAI78212.1 hypothetical protein HMF3257_36455 [Spirosoma telluris]